MNLTEQLKARSSITTSDYMRACVQEYYANAAPFGRGGDFITAPDISQIFGEVFGAWIAYAWLQQGSLGATLLELGGGRGTLMNDLLRATRHVPEFHARITVVMVETSPQLAEIQLQTLEGAHPHISTQAELILPPCPCFIVANEFFDALPIEQFLNGVERKVKWDEHAGFGFEDSGIGEITEHCPDAETIMHTICAHIKTYGGAFLTADYGYTQPVSGDTLQAMEVHAYVSIFETPGEADITAHVNFAALEKIARTHGLSTRVQTQGEFLLEHGAKLRAEQLCAKADAAGGKPFWKGLRASFHPRRWAIYSRFYK